MAFPEDPLGLRGYLELGGTQVDITADLYTRDPITHSRGRAYRANAADPGECTATIKNVDGTYTPRNAEGPYYGLLSRNTPFEFSLPGATTHLSTIGVGDRARTPDAAGISITGDIDVRVDAWMADWAPDNPTEVAGKYNAAAGRSWLIFLYQGSAWFYWSPDGTTEIQSHSTVPLVIPPGGRMSLRVTLDVNNGASGRTVTYYTGPTISGPWTQLGDSVVQAGVTSIFDNAEGLDVGAVGPISFADPAARFYAFQLRNGINGTLVANPDFSAQTLGATTFADSVGLTWTLNGTASISNRIIRFAGEVPEWPTKWSTSEKDAWTPIEAAGVLRRLGKGEQTVDSTLRRRIPSGSPLAYWPLEDGRDATQFYSPIAGVAALKTSGMSLAADDSLAGSSALPSVSGGATLSGAVPAPSGSPTSWHTEFIYYLPNTGPATARTVIQWTGTGTVKRWRMLLKTQGSEIYGYDAEDNVVTSALLVLTGLGTFNAWTRWQLYAVQNGANVDWTVRWIPIGGSGVASTTSFAGSVGRINGVKGPDGGYSSDLDGMILGHIAAFTTANTTIYNSADIGFAGETAAARMTRLCAEEGVPLTVVGDPSGTQRVGPQRPSNLLDVLRDAAAADGGIFGETRDRRELQYRTRESLYNQTPKITLDYAAKKIAPPFEPVDDDQVRNEWAVTRDGGSTAVASLPTGPLSIEDIGRYPDSATLSLFTDDQTDLIAGWLLHTTTWDENRYPSLTLRLHRHPEFVAAVLDLDIGDKIRITNLPKRFASPGAVDLLVDGWTEELLPRKWEITFTCSPAGPWEVAVTDDLVLGRADTEGAQLAAAMTSTATSADVLTTAGPVWATDPAELPFDVRVGGEVWSVTAAASWATDAFGRTTANGWGTADSGQAWTATGGVAGNFAVGSGVGSHTLSTTNASRRTVTPFTYPDLDVLVDVTSSAAATGGSLYGGPVVRYTDQDNLYFARVEFTTGNVGILSIRKRVASVETQLGTYTLNGAYTAGTFYRVRFKASGSALKAKAWVVGALEPGDWLVEVTDSSLTTSVSVGVLSISATGNTNVSPAVRYDSLNLFNPQKFTAVRSVNGVVKAQTSGTDVRLAYPAYTAL